MGKQTSLLQTQTDMDILKNYLNQLGFKIYYKEFKNDKSFLVNATTLKYQKQYYLSLINLGDSQRLSLCDITIEYSSPEIYCKHGEIDLIECGRVWIKSGIQNELNKYFEIIRKWIRNNYTHIDYYWFAPDLLKQVKEKKVIPTTNFGSLQIVDENLNIIFKDTWKKNCRYRDGEWVDNTDSRYYNK